MWSALKSLDASSVALALILGLVFLVLYEIFRINTLRAQTPPGPRPLPFVGNLPETLKDPINVIKRVSLVLVTFRACRGLLF